MNILMQNQDYLKEKIPLYGESMKSKGTKTFNVKLEKLDGLENKEGNDGRDLEKLADLVQEQNDIHTDSDDEAIKSENMSCGHHHSSHSDEEDNHDLIMAGLAQPKRNIIKKTCMMYPDDLKAMIWEGLISIVLLTSCFTTPISLAYPNLQNEDLGYGALNITLDLIFAFEIILNFRYAYEDETYQIIDCSKEIAKNYIKGWFPIDVIAIFPIDLLIMSTTIQQE